MGVAKKIASMDTASVVEPLGSEDSTDIANASTSQPGEAWWRPIVQSPLFVPAVACFAGILYLFWFIVVRSVRLWTDDSGYYTHGFLVPFISGYVVYRKWDEIKATPIKTGYWALPVLAFLGYAGYVTTHTKVFEGLSIAFMLSILAAIWFVAGWKWMGKLTFPVLYLSFALPLFTGMINLNTNRAQLWSTTAAYEILKALGFDPLKTDPTTIMLAHFNLDVAVPCSGLKLLLAVTAFTAFFMMIANLKWWGNLAMVAVVLPLCVFINGLRIALIGMVGTTWGEDAGHTFHDYSGYITLIVCFFLLFKIARGLGWKD